MTSAPRRVGFDLDKAAQSVTVYVVVAADLAQTLTIDASLSGTDTRTNNDLFATQHKDVSVGRFDEFLRRGFAEFELTPVSGKRVAAAVLRLYQVSVSSSEFEHPYDFGPVLVDHLQWNPAAQPPAEDLFNAEGTVSLLSANIGAISSDATIQVYTTLDVTTAVVEDITHGRNTSQFRFRFTNDVLRSS